MKKGSSKHSTDAELKDCINSAYSDLQILLKGVFINLVKLPHQVTIFEFQSLFENNDWNDIFNCLEELENEQDIADGESVLNILLESIKSNISINHLTDPMENTYYKAWSGIMTNEDF